jgi:carbonic anhydrase/acetyltransferase-like protein (isoleucine patch superfamily)
MIYSVLNFTPQIGNNCFIAPNAVIAGDVAIGKNSSVWFGCLIRGDVAPITIGSNTNIQDGTTVHVSRANHIQNGTKDKLGVTVIGNNVTVGHNCIIHACTIANNTFIGMGSILLDLSEMEENSMLAAGSLLTGGKIVKSGELWAGRPAKFMRFLTEEEIAYIGTSANNYKLLSEQYISTLKNA